MAAPVAGDASMSLRNSDPQLINNEHRSTPGCVEEDLTISQLTKSRTSRLPPPAPLTSSSGKRRKSRPVRYGGAPTAVEKTYSPSKLKIVVRDPSSKCVSSPAMIRAREVQSSLGTECPSFIKSMVRSHVSTGFSMGLPLPFSKLFLPKMDTTMVIEDENGEKYDLRYIAYKCGLSAGWKKFVVGHNLLEGDVLVFHLVEPCKFKVYIIRANDLNKVDGALSLLNLEVHAEQTTPDNHIATVTPSRKTKRGKHPKSLPLTVVQKKHKLSTPPSQISSHPIEHSGNDSEEVGSEVLEASKPSRPELSLRELKSFEDFRIMVNGLCIDSELPDDVRMNYYKLCTCKKGFLHDALPECLYHKLVAGIIGETVNIANEIKNCSLATTKEEFQVWDNSLKSFELLGMKVGFLRDRISLLSRLAFESEGRLDVERYMEAKKGQKHLEDEIKRLTAKLVELNESSRRFEGIVEALKHQAERHELKFQEEVDAPW